MGLEPSRAAKFCSASLSPTKLLSYLCVSVAETVETVHRYVFWTLLVVLKSQELAFSVFIESASRDASKELINSLYSCRKYKKPGPVLHQDLNFADAHAICYLISLTKWRVYTCIPFLI